MEDADLVGAARAGDRGAFAILVGRHRPHAAATARRLLGDRDEADDIVQEAVLSAFAGLAGLREPGRFGAWLTAIARNLALMRLRSRRRVVPLGELPEPPAAPDDSLPDVLAGLPVAQRDAVLLRYVDGLSCDEIAERLSISAGAVRVRLHRARARLRAELRKESHMVEMDVQQVLVRGDEGPGTRVLLLKEKSGERVLPIWVGQPEGDALAIHLGGGSTERPMTADFTSRLLATTGATVERVVIERLHESVFFASVRIVAGGSTSDVDARPSDALNLAVRVGAPVFVEEDVLAEGALAPGDLEQKLAEKEECHRSP